MKLRQEMMTNHVISQGYDLVRTQIQIWIWTILKHLSNISVEQKSLTYKDEKKKKNQNIRK